MVPALENWPVATTSSQRCMLEEDRSLVERATPRLPRLMKGINRALADAVERHDQGSRNERHSEGRAGVVCHPESEPRRKLHWTQKIYLPPHIPVSYGGSFGSGARPSDTANNDPNTVTGDVTGEERRGEDPRRTRLEQAAKMTWVAMSR